MANLLVEGLGTGRSTRTVTSNADDPKQCCNSWRRLDVNFLLLDGLAAQSTKTMLCSTYAVLKTMPMNFV